MFLNLLGILRNKHDQLIPYEFREDDVSAGDLGGKLVDLTTLPAEDRDLFVGFLKMADKAAAHLTMPAKHPWEDAHVAITLICRYLKVHLYYPAGQILEGAVP